MRDRKKSKEELRNITQIKYVFDFFFKDHMSQRRKVDGFLDMAIISLYIINW